MKNKLWVLTALVSILFATTLTAQDTKNTDETREAVRKEREAVRKEREAAREKREALREEMHAQREKRRDEEEKRRDEEEARRDKAEMEREARDEKGKCDTCKTKKHHSVTISNQGIYIESSDSAGVKSKHVERQGKFSSNFALMDLGVNLISDNTNYAAPSVQNYLNVPSAMKTKSLFDIRTGKSINVNIYPWMVKYHALKTKKQRIYISTGIGLQLYNFRFDESLTYTKNPSGIILDTIVFKKNKLALDYLNVPLMLTFKTRISKNNWLIYGVGITEGYRIGSLNKQVSGERGKVKTRGSFGLADFNTCLNAEFGVEGIVRFFASYQLTSLYDSGAGLDQHPICFGFRLSGI